MKISDLRAGMNGVNITARVVKVVEKTEVETRFGRSRLTVVELSDETGSVRLNLWRRQADLVKVGDLIRIENGFVLSFKGQLELNVGGKGRIITLSRARY